MIASRALTPATSTNALPAPLSTLREKLDALALRFGPAHLASDPLRVPRRYADPADREIAAFVAALLAFGNAQAVCASAEAALEALVPSPSRAVRELASGRGPRSSGPVHRWVRGEDLTAFLIALGRLREEEGGLEGSFLRRDPGGDDLSEALAAFVEALASRVPEQARGRRGLSYLLVSPRRGSACKRWNMLLRWLVRPDDGLDLGLWRGVDPARLVVPLDTHVARIGRYVGLTARRTADWRAAREITESLARFDPDDPVRYDFAISRLGILDRCPRRRRVEICRGCDLREVCAL